MNRRNWPLFAVTLALIAGSAGLLTSLSAHQKLGPTPVKAHALPNSNRLQVDLPEQVLDYQSEWVEVDELTLNTLPPDTSFGQRRYKGPDGFALILNAVVMGTDRTSLHKPQFCLTGQGYQIDESTETNVHIDQPCSYDLPVVKLVASREIAQGGQRQVVRAVYVYWFVADDALSASISGFERMWLMGSNLLRTGVLQRWAYISCLSGCQPGQEAATFERMKQFISASVPEFQLNPHTPETAASARP